MQKNVKLKRLFKSTISPILSVINEVIPKDDRIILLYSANKGMQHNLVPVRDYLLEQGYDKKYKIICGIESLEYKDNAKVTYVDKYKSVLTFFRAKHVYYTTGQIPIKPANSQIVIHLDHGTTAIKTGNLLTNINNGDDFFFTYYMAPSPIYIPVILREFNCEKENVKINGEPTLDIFAKKTEPYNLVEGIKGLWAPTFRQSDYLGYSDSDEEDLIPLFKEQDYSELNEVLREYNIHLYVKLHPCQNTDGYNLTKYSNLTIFSSDDFEKHGYEIYRFMKQMDFMIADYSSVYLEYLLLNRPIGFAIPDIEEYSEKRGFIFDNIQEYMPGDKMNSKQDVYNFLKKMSEGVDDFAEERMKVCNKVHYYQDGKNCERCLKYSNITL
ncbi:MAG: CDP-glycerol glycerophosphotransferase family protein [Lachnospira sp.]|nr:CDP-glycerol glycerophosphotransferase family protein [Lachnospira sp.]